MSSTPQKQKALLLREVKTRYELADFDVPLLEHEKHILVRSDAIALNPIDWKAPDFGYGIPQLPYIAGRELAGQVISLKNESKSRIKKGDRVMVISTDYRDLRKAAYQQYALATTFNVARLPSHITSEQGSATGVAFVTTLLALGICTGLDFTSICDGPDLQSLVRQIDINLIPEDIRQECLDGLNPSERAKRGDWIAIWGGSSTCAYILNQLAHLAGLRTILVLDTKKHGLRLAAAVDDAALRADVVIDSEDPERAIEIIRAVTNDSLRFGVDCVGRSSAESLVKGLKQRSWEGAGKKRAREEEDERTPPATPPLEASEKEARSHLVGLSGIPKQLVLGVKYHNVPVKLFHEVEEVGEAVVTWLERLLDEKKLVPPHIHGVLDGLEGINDGLDRMRRREISGGRLVAKLRHS